MYDTQTVQPKRGISEIRSEGKGREKKLEEGGGGFSEEEKTHFWEKVGRKGKRDCWEWRAYRQPKGYGLIAHGRGTMLAHRMSWLLNVGMIPDGLCVLHKCDNASCVNPSHLFLGTRADNNHDMERKGRAVHPEGDNNGSRLHPELLARGSRHGMSKLTEPEVREIRSEYKTGTTTHRRLATKFGVARSLIRFIVKRITWKHI